MIPPPTSEPVSPMTIVSQAGIGSGPGTAHRARAPMAKPKTTAEMKYASTPEACHGPTRLRLLTFWRLRAYADPAAGPTSKEQAHASPSPSLQRSFRAGPRRSGRRGARPERVRGRRHPGREDRDRSVHELDEPAQDDRRAGLVLVRVHSRLRGAVRTLLRRRRVRHRLGDVDE